MAHRIKALVAFTTVLSAVSFGVTIGAVPASASSFILETVLARVLLKEKIGSRRAAGTLLVLCGVVLLGK